MLLVLKRECDIAAGRMAECTVEASFRLFNKALRCPEYPLCIPRSVNGSRIVSSKETCLQLAGPVPARYERQSGVTRNTALDLGLAKLAVVEDTECLV